MSSKQKIEKFTYQNEYETSYAMNDTKKYH